MSQQESRIDWPVGWERTPPGERTRNNKYQVTMAKAFKDLEDELERIGVDDFRYSFGPPSRQRDGRPYANARAEDPGFVLRWSMDGDQYAVACDAYTRLRDNVRTVGLYIREKRKMENRPVSTGESEFANARLPPGDEDRAMVVGRQPPHEVLGVAPDAPENVVRAAARRLAADVHPDKDDGDADEFKRIQKAKERMLDG